MSAHSPRLLLAAVCMMAITISPAWAEEPKETPTTTDRPDHLESEEEHGNDPAPEIDTPPLPAGMKLDEVFERSASPPPRDWPAVIPDERTYVFFLFEQVEYRFADGRSPDHLGWEAQGWVGGDLNKFWWKTEGEAIFEGRDHGESETDLLYSRLISPFWNLQGGVQYANEWEHGGYHDRFSGVIAIQGLVPYKFEVDTSLYVSEDADVTLDFEAEYDLRITQRLVLQPLVMLSAAFQDIPERGLASGLTDTHLDLRLRYEIKRELAPYVGARYRALLGGTEDLAEAVGESTSETYFMAGLRFAF